MLTPHFSGDTKMQLYEKYRPQSLNDFIGQDKIKNQITRLTNRPGWDRDAIWLQGPSGTGKTSLAWIIASQVANDFDVNELDGDKCSIQAVRGIEANMGLCSMFGGWRVWIVNEAHAMSHKAVQGWLTLLERLPEKRLIIFTTTELLNENLFGNFSSPLGSRCKVFTFTNQGLAQDMAKRAKEIAEAENLDGQPLSKYVRLVQDCRNNMRQVLQRIDSCEMG